MIFFYTTFYNMHIIARFALVATHRGNWRRLIVIVEEVAGALAPMAILGMRDRRR